MRPALWLFVPVATALALAARPSEACTLISNPKLVLDPVHAADVTPPGEVTIIASFHEHSDEIREFCGPSGSVTLQVSATDDATPTDLLGYLVITPQGPFFGSLPVDPITASDGELIFYTRTVDIDVDLEIRAVDLNGNMGPPTVVTVVHEGGCSAASADSLGIAIALLGLVRRRRGRPG